MFREASQAQVYVVKKEVLDIPLRGSLTRGMRYPKSNHHFLLNCRPFEPWLPRRAEGCSVVIFPAN